MINNVEKEERKEISFKKEEDMGNKGWVTDGGDEARKRVTLTRRDEVDKTLTSEVNEDEVDKTLTRQE